jgi:hypothetical protein
MCRSRRAASPRPVSSTPREQQPMGDTSTSSARAYLRLYVVVVPTRAAASLSDGITGAMVATGKSAGGKLPARATVVNRSVWTARRADCMLRAIVMQKEQPVCPGGEPMYYLMIRLQLASKNLHYIAAHGDARARAKFAQWLYRHLDERTVTSCTQSSIAVKFHIRNWAVCLSHT